VDGVRLLLREPLRACAASREPAQQIRQKRTSRIGDKLDQQIKNVVQQTLEIH
jgi:hypothetical protein